MIQSSQPEPNGTSAPPRAGLWCAGGLILAAVSWIIVLGRFNIADGDLWAKLALGADVFVTGHLPTVDRFAFTPVLAQYIDHEWGAGLFFFAFLKWLGPDSLLALKIVLSLIGLAACTWLGRRAGARWPVLLILLIPVAWAVLPGYVPVIRSHAFTYCFFALTLLLLDFLVQGRKWASLSLVALMLCWTNLHGGFVSGLGVITLCALFHLRQPGKSWWLLVTVLGCWMATLVNPYGIAYWGHIVPALLHPRMNIVEWRPLPWWGWDAFAGFRVLFVLVVLAVVLGWKKVGNHSVWRVFMLALAAFLAWRSRRHAPFFGLTVLAFAGPYFEATGQIIKQRLEWAEKHHSRALWVAVGVHFAVALVMLQWLLPQVAFQVLAPVGEYPVREIDVLSLGQVRGNLAVPFHWGSYAAWRLHPSVKVSIDGRYEAAYPESTFHLNNDFFYKTGADWARLLRDYPVDYILLDLRTQTLRPEDLKSLGYDLIYSVPAYSALMAKSNYVSRLREVAANLPDSTIQPLDARIPLRWLSGADASASKAMPSESVPTVK